MMVHRSEQGLTLVELMISLALGLLVSMAAGWMLIGQRSNHAVNDDLARLQENARLAMESLQRDIRMAGYIGCPSLRETTPEQHAQPAPDPAVDWDHVLEGEEANPDRLALYRISNHTLPLTADMSAATAAIPIPPSPWDADENDLFAEGGLMVISDCQRADVFRLSQAVSRDDTQLRHGASHNTTPSLQTAYTALAQVSPLLRIRHYIAPNAAGNPAFFREVNGQAEEVVENVRDMQLTYGVDDGAGNPARANDGSVDRYLPADRVPDWRQVLTVRVRLLLRSPNQNIASAALSTAFWDADEDGINDLDPAIDADIQARRLLYVSSAVITLRNRTAVDRN